MKNRKIYICSDISWQNYFGTTYIIKEISNKLYTFEDMGAEIWNEIHNGITYEELLDNISKKYEETDELDETLQDFLSQLANFNLICLE